MTVKPQPKSSILKDARVAKGITLYLVHEATKIPLDALKAIEEGYSVRMLTPFYFKGFIKIYAEFLGLNVEEVFVQYGLDQKAVIKPHVPVGKIILKDKKPNPFAVFFKSVVTSENLMILGRFIVFVLVLFGLFKMSGCLVNTIKKWPKAQPKVQQKTLKVEPKKIIPQVVKNKTVQPQAPKVENKTINVSSKKQTIELAVRASRDSWVQVKADDKIVFQMTMTKGSMESWEANNLIELSGNNINELEMEVNGKHVGALGSSERNAKKVIITKEGLTVKK